jgi:hypothetical protein
MTNGSNVQPHRGTMILTLGIVGLVCCMPCGIVAWVMGNGDLRAMAEGRMDRAGEGMTKAGKVLGMISVALTLIGIVIWVALTVLGLSAGALSSQ